MPSHKRKQLRKIKKTMKRNVDKAKQKQEKQAKGIADSKKSTTFASDLCR